MEGFPPPASIGHAPAPTRPAFSAADAMPPLVNPAALFKLRLPCRRREKLWPPAAAGLDEACVLPSFADVAGVPDVLSLSLAWNPQGLGVRAEVRGVGRAVVPYHAARRQRRPPSLDRHAAHRREPSRRPLLPAARAPAHRRRPAGRQGRRGGGCDPAHQRGAGRPARRLGRDRIAARTATAGASTPSSRRTHCRASIPRRFPASASSRRSSIAGSAGCPASRRRSFRGTAIPPPGSSWISSRDRPSLARTAACRPGRAGLH